MKAQTIQYHRRFAIVCAVLLAATIFAFAGVRNSGFVNYDDPYYVRDNPHVNGGVTREGVRWAFTTPHSGNWHALTWISHMVDCELFGLDPAGHHMINLLIHALNAVLLLALLHNATGAFWPSAFVAAAFALHPLRVESVAWISERKDVLSGLFWILTMAAYVMYARRGGILRYMAVFVCLALGLLAKPMLVTLPFVLLLMDFWPLRRFATEAQRHKGTEAQSAVTRTAGFLVVEKLPLIMLAAAAGVLTVVVQRAGGAVGSLEVFGFGDRLANALVSYAAYIGKTLCPVNLAVMYPYPVGGLAWYKPVIAALVIAVISAAAWRLRRRFPFVLFGWLWYLGTLVPVIGLVQVGQQAMADRYTYIPSIGLFIMIAWSAGELVSRRRLRQVAAGIVAGIIIVSMILMTRTQTSYWKDSLTLFGHALDVTDGNFSMEKEYAKELCAAGRFEDAVKHFDRAVSIHPRDYEALSYKARVLIQQSKIRQALPLLEKAIEIKPDHAEAHYYLGLAKLVEGHRAGAIESFRRALDIKGVYPEAAADLEKALLDEGKPLLDAGNADEAIELYKQVLNLNARSAAAWNDMGVALARKGHIERAMENFRKAIEMDPAFADAYCNLALALYSAGRYKESEGHIKQALRFDPGMERARKLREALEQRLYDSGH